MTTIQNAISWIMWFLGFALLLAFCAIVGLIWYILKTTFRPTPAAQPTQSEPTQPKASPFIGLKAETTPGMPTVPLEHSPYFAREQATDTPIFLFGHVIRPSELLGYDAHVKKHGALMLSEYVALLALARRAKADPTYFQAAPPPPVSGD